MQTIRQNKGLHHMADVHNRQNCAAETARQRVDACLRKARDTTKAVAAMMTTPIRQVQ
jgi:hypothetical protein